MKCDICGGEAKDTYLAREAHLDTFLCPTHYAQVREYIERLKPRDRTAPLTWRLEPHGARPSNGYKLGTLYGCDIWADLDATLSEYTKWCENQCSAFLFDSHRWTVAHGKDYILKGDALCVGDSDKEVKLTEAAANALYDHMRAEREAHGHIA
jgi:hypothetical protein